MKWKWYWWNFKEQFLGGWDAIKKIWDDVDIVEDVKATYRRLKEEDEYEAMQKRYLKKVVLPKDTIITFHDPKCWGNEVIGKVTDNYKSYVYDRRFVAIEVISSPLFKKGELIQYSQIDVMNNIIQMGGNLYE